MRLPDADLQGAYGNFGAIPSAFTGNSHQQHFRNHCLKIRGQFFEQARVITLMTTRAKQRANKSGMEDFPWEEGPEADYYYY